MGWHTMPSYSINEAALLIAELNPSEVESPGSAKRLNYDGWESAISWHRGISEAIKSKELVPYNGVVFVEASPDSQLVEINNLDYWADLDCFKTRISRSELRRWTSIHDTAPVFLFNMQERSIAENMGYENAKARFLRNEVAADDERQVSDHSVSASQAFETPPDLLEIQKLLDGSHEHQAEELALAVKAWLGVSKLYSQDLQSAPSPNKEAAAWLDDNAPNIGPTKRDRIATVVNWNKSGGRTSSSA